MNQYKTLSIGAVSQATGVPVETLRTWERRYNYPKPERTEGRQRAYHPSTVETLNLVVKAIAQGHRPSRILGHKPSELRTMLGERLEEVPPSLSAAPQNPRDIFYLPVQATQEPIVSWMKALDRMDGAQLEAGFHSELSSLGVIAFIKTRLHPFLLAIGNAWAKGDISVSHEHFVSERIRDFLTSQWRPMSDRAKGPQLLLSCLPGEHHCLGLHIIATLVALGGCKVLFLGANMPLENISTTATERQMPAVLISISRAANTEQVVRDLRLLHQDLDARNIQLVVGGRGAPGNMSGMQVMSDLAQVFDWSSELARLHQA